jgi:predicted helicase
VFVTGLKWKGNYNPMELINDIYMKRFSIENMFDEFIRQATSFYEMPAHTLQEMRARQNTKARGDIFEEFCAIYLKNVCGYENVWLLADVPDATLTQLSMKRKDMGIDLVVQDKGSFYAVQCKYKKFTGKPTCVSWQALSTFYALCMRTGPWKKYIVMTNCNFVRHQGKKTQADISICLNSFRGITHDEWRLMAFASAPAAQAKEAKEAKDLVNPEGHQGPKHQALTQEEVRQKRLAYFSSAASPVIPPP